MRDTLAYMKDDVNQLNQQAEIQNAVMDDLSRIINPLALSENNDDELTRNNDDERTSVKWFCKDITEEEVEEHLKELEDY